MDGARDQYEERLKDVFESFDGSGSGSLCSEELTHLCRALQLEENTLNALLHALLHDQLSARVDFEQFKDALILVLSSSNTEDPQECPEQPEFGLIKQGCFAFRNSDQCIKSKTAGAQGVKKGRDQLLNYDKTIGTHQHSAYLRRIFGRMLVTKQFLDPIDYHSRNKNNAFFQITLCNNIIPRFVKGSKRYGQVWCVTELMRFHTVSLCSCELLCASPATRTTLWTSLRVLVVNRDFICVSVCVFILQNIFFCVKSHTDSYRYASTYAFYNFLLPLYMKFDESGRRISCALSGTIGLRLFSVLDDGSGHVPVETLLYRWMEEGVDNSAEILRALDFNSEDKVNLSELTVALENELLNTKNSIHQAALVSFKAEIRHLLECVDMERREKERIRLDLDKVEKLKSQLASEVDDHHAAIERNNELNLRKLEQEYKDGMSALRAELSKEVELVQQQANQQQEELEKEMSKMKEEENFLREHLTLTIKENGRLEAELIDSMEKLVEGENQINKLQKNLDGVLKERFGDLDPDSAEFFQQENRLRQLRMNYEEQCRELQDRIDELEAHLKEYQTLGHTPSTRPGQSLSEELATTSPDPERDGKRVSRTIRRSTQRLQEEKKMQERLAEQWEQEREFLQKRHEEVLRAHVEETQQWKEQECIELERRLKEEWERERLELVKSSKETLQVMLEEKESKLREKWLQEKRELEEVRKETLQAVLEERTERERRFREKWDEEHALLEKEHYEALLQRLEEERECLHAQQEETERTMEKERLQLEREEQERRWQKVLKEEQSRMEETHRESMLELSAKHFCSNEISLCLNHGINLIEFLILIENFLLEVKFRRHVCLLFLLKLIELETQFSQRLKEVEVHFCDQEAVSERFQLDQELLRQVQDLEREEVKMKSQQLELTHARDIKTLTDKNVQLQAELESVISAAQSKEIELSRQLNELDDHLQERMEAKDLMLAQAEHKAAEPEPMLQQAVDDFIQKRVELRKSLSTLESERGEGLSEIMELKCRIQESEELLCQAVEVLRNERLELEEKLKPSISLLMAKEDERVALLAEKDTLASNVVHKEPVHESNQNDTEEDFIDHKDTAVVESANMSNITKAQDEADGVVADSDLTKLENTTDKTTKIQKDFERGLCSNEILDLQEMTRGGESRVLEGKMHVAQDFHKQQMSLLEESTRLREDNCKLKELLNELEKHEEIQQWDSDCSDSSDDSVFELNTQLKEKISAMANQEFFNMQILKNQNSRLRQVLVDLQGKTLRIHIQMQERRKEVCRLAKENLILRHRISTVREEDLRENQENLRLQHMKQGKRAAQALRRQLFQLFDRDDFKRYKNTQKILCGQFIQKCFSKCINCIFLCSDENRERYLEECLKANSFEELLTIVVFFPTIVVIFYLWGMSLESSLQTLTQQNAHLKSDLRITQQERDALKQEVISLHKQMQSANEKVSRWDKTFCRLSWMRTIEHLFFTLSGLMEVEHASLMDENQRLKRQTSEMNSELKRAREQICQLEALSLKLRALVKGADQEKTALRRELDALHSQLISTRKKVIKKSHTKRYTNLLCTILSGLQSYLHLLYSCQGNREDSTIATAQTSPCSNGIVDLNGVSLRLWVCSSDHILAYDEREVALLHMEDRMREVEVTLRNLKLLLQEKVSQLKEQLTRNGEADVLIKDLYMENAQLLKALEKTEQRQKVAEKKNFLLEEKISSLNKIVRDLGPSPLTPTPYHFARS
ncbi:Ninein [Triplophysa tibetana]|uniref:Ninein n=1 Tax=Triplophysa tibetana TaxID=1572043 RepID=A0A5A9P6V2_9TELE|nr:Ninein [Triplophysa tibetana]